MGAVAATIQQDKTSPEPERFLQDFPAKPKKNKHKLDRVAFKVSRLMEFCSSRELQNQTGHHVSEWPLVVVKELIDNSLDACEEAEIGPVIMLAVSPGEIVIQDNGAGIPVETIRNIHDYGVRVSSREAYVSPSRGAQGNALKTILAMGYVLDRERDRDDGDNANPVGRTIIEANGAAHEIRFSVDHVTNEPRITYTVAQSPVTTGTRVTVRWPEQPWDRYYDESLIERAERDLKKLVEGYTWFNPHLTLRGTWNGGEFINVEASNPGWTKWGPRDPTSPHWYTPARLQRYLSAHVARDRELGRDRPVREFIAEFRGLSSTQKQKAILAEIGASYRSLREFFGADRVNKEGIERLLAAMKHNSEPVKPKHLGVIGRDHLKARFLAAGGAEQTFKYERYTGDEDDVPYVIETAFGVQTSGLDGGNGQGRKLVTGANWSVGISNPFKSIGRTGEGLETKLAAIRANSTQPVIFAVHVAKAHLQFADRGKSSILMNGEDVEPTDV
jgi:DNA topoisomerase VI subunit B